jgi:hypothetical protein
MRIAIAGADLAGAILRDFGAIAQTGDAAGRLAPPLHRLRPSSVRCRSPGRRRMQANASAGRRRKLKGARQAGRYDAEAGRAAPQK